MKIKYFYLFLIPLFYLQYSFGNSVTTEVIKELNATIYRLQSPADTIIFIKADTNTTCKKPTLLFCQGSLPVPLVIYYRNYGPQFSFFNFDYRKLSDKYNLIAISMPHTPPILADSRLNPDGTYSPDSTLPSVFDPAYTNDNYLEKYVQRANQVISYVLSQPWADPEALYIIGHSQGASVGVQIAQTNNKVKALAYLSGDPDGRFTQKVKNIRKLVYQKKMTSQEAQEQLNGLYDWWKKICVNEQLEGNSGDTPLTWQSFSWSLRNVLVNLKIPVFMAYGTEDIAGSSCELMPVYFELNRKTDYKIYPVVGCGHNFEEFTPDGKPDYKNMHWQEVIEHFIKYIED